MNIPSKEEQYLAVGKKKKVKEKTEILDNEKSPHGRSAEGIYRTSKKTSGDITIKRTIRNRILDMRVSLYLPLTHPGQLKRK